MKQKFRLKYFSLTLVLLGLFLFSIIGQFLTGFETYQQELEAENLPMMESRLEYLSTGHFISSVAENMESEFLQMALFVYLTMCLYQIGSAESQKPDFQKTGDDIAQEKLDQEYVARQRAKKGISWRLYENSLTLSLVVLFIISLVAHSYGSYKMVNVQKQASHEELISYPEIFKEPDFWFESFQNWQSEFFSIAVMGVLSIFLRQKKSPQSKKMMAHNWDTGN